MAVAVDRDRPADPTGTVFDVDEFARMGEAGIFTEDDRVELIDADVREMTPIRLPATHGPVRAPAIRSRTAHEAPAKKTAGTPGKCGHVENNISPLPRMLHRPPGKSASQPKYCDGSNSTWGTP